MKFYSGKYYYRYSYSAWSQIWISDLYKMIIDDFLNINPNDIPRGGGFCYKEGLKARYIINNNYSSIRSFIPLCHVGFYAPSMAKLHLSENRIHRKHAKYWYKPIFKRMPIKLGSIRIIEFKCMKKKKDIL